ncbi:helix-turn-helix domain-containing protein [Nonomuraea ferruginea]
MGGIPVPGCPWGALLRGWRERALLTQEQLAERACLNVRTVRRMESGALLRPRVTSMLLLAEALELNGADRATLNAAAHGLARPGGGGAASGDRAPAAARRRRRAG